MVITRQLHAHAQHNKQYTETGINRKIPIIVGICKNMA